MTSLLHPHASRYLPFNYERWGCLEPYQLYGNDSWQVRVKRLCGRLCEELGDLPLRLDFKIAKEWDLRQAERKRGMEPYALKDADQILRVLRDDAEFAKMSTAEAEALVDHPDERVVEGVVRLRHEWLKARPALAERLARRALEDALREGVVWTPLVDRIAIADLWPEPLPEPTYDSDPDGYFSRPHGLHASKESWLNTLLTWLRTASPEEAHLMLRFQSDEARLSAVLGAKDLSTASVSLVLRAMPFAHLLARNADLGREGAGLLLDWVLEVAASSDLSVAPVVDFTLFYLAKRGHQVPPESADRLATSLRSGKAILPGTSPVSAAWILARQRDAAPERLRWIVLQFAAENELMVEIAHHERGDVQVWRVLAASSSLPRLRKRLSEIPAARQDEEVRRVLLSSKALDVLTNLVRGASPEEFVELLERIADKNANAAAEVIGASPEYVARIRAQLERNGARTMIVRLERLQCRLVECAAAPPSSVVTITGRPTSSYEFEYSDVDDLLAESPQTTKFRIQVVEDTNYESAGEPVQLKSLFVDLNGTLDDARVLYCRLMIAEKVPYSYHFNAAEILRREFAGANQRAKEIASRLASYIKMGGWLVSVTDGYSTGGDEHRKPGSWIAGGVSGPEPALISRTP